LLLKKAKAGDLQSAINQEEERGLDAFHLSKGHIRKANHEKRNKDTDNFLVTVGYD
jgi:hypothetical protein